MGGSIFDSSSESASTTSNQEHSHVLVPDQALITFESEVSRPTEEGEEPIPLSSLTNSINDIT